METDDTDCALPIHSRKTAEEGLFGRGEAQVQYAADGAGQRGVGGFGCVEAIYRLMRLMEYTLFFHINCLNLDFPDGPDGLIS